MDHFGSLKLSARRDDAHAPLSEELLVLAAQAGQEWAFIELCSQCSKRIFIMLYKITKNREDAEDVLQDSILKAFVHFKNFNRDSAFSTWLRRISINSALMMLRRKRVRPEVSIDVPSDHGNEVFQWEIADRRANPEDLYLGHERSAHLQAAISRLPKTYRDLVEIRQQSDGSLKEIAEHVGITVEATKSRMMRATKALRSSLSQHDSNSAVQLN
jgi:RNA polymerase sigma-70 factor (ECF subfamily)